MAESPYSCHPEFLDSRMTSLSSYGFVFGSADSIGTSDRSLGTFFFDLLRRSRRRADGDARLNIRYVEFANSYFSDLEVFEAIVAVLFRRHSGEKLVEERRKVTSGN